MFIALLWAAIVVLVIASFTLWVTLAEWRKMGRAPNLKVPIGGLGAAIGGLAIIDFVLWMLLTWTRS